jgi:tetratricopeptide (TPR) repeat protein
MNPTRRIGRLPVVCIATVLGCAAHQSFEQAVGIDVSIDSLPHGAALVEGGNAIGTTPARYSLNDEADHVLTLQRDGFHPVEITVNGAKMKAAGGGDFFVAMAPEDFVGTSVSATDAKQLAHAAEALLKKGNAADATQFYKQMIVLQPGAAPPYKGLGICYSKLGNKKEALDAYRKYLLYAPDAADAPRIREIVEKAAGGIVIPPPKEEDHF